MPSRGYSRSPSRAGQTLQVAGSKSVVTLAVNGSNLLAMCEDAGGVAVLRAHDTRSGAVRWDTEIDGWWSSVRSVAAKGERVIVSGSPQSAEVSGTYGVDTRTGEIAWQAETYGVPAAIVGKQAYVIGDGVTAFTAR
jgi:outer membrane protein assembly factor BamB